MNNNEKSVLMTFDLKKAFDCVNHQILISKLTVLCDQKSLEIFESYLTNRSFVKYNDKISSFKNYQLSVPQGGCLAPLFYFIYQPNFY